MFEILATAPFVINDSLIPNLPADAFITTYDRLNMIAALCFIAGYAIRAITEKHKAKKEALPCSSN